MQFWQNVFLTNTIKMLGKFLNKCVSKILFILLIICAKNAFADVESTNYKHSVSAQFGLNGEASDFSTFGLQVFPFDTAYTYKLFDNNRYAFSTSTFYDNIGVQIDGLNFNYRLGQRVDLNFEFKDTLFYGTIGVASMFIDNEKNIESVVYGFGIVRDVTDRFAVVTELNFQNLAKNMKNYDIINFSIGVIYSFDL